MQSCLLRLAEKSGFYDTACRSYGNKLFPVAAMDLSAATQ
jgi:hypothetical protein